jgi:hypothetical protein
MYSTLIFIVLLFVFLDTLQVTGDFATLESKTLWGTLRGLETFSQLVVENEDLTVNFTRSYILKAKCSLIFGIQVDS